MRRRVLSAILGVTLLAVILFGVPLGVGLERFADEQATLKLERQAVAAARQLPSNPDAIRTPPELPHDGGIQFGLYDAAGRRVAGVGPRHGDAVVAAALRDQVIQREVPGGRATAIPYGSNDRLRGALRASQSTSVAENETDRINYLLVALAAIVLLVGAVVGWLLAGRLARPVKQLRDDAVRLGGGDFRVRSAPTGIRELDDAGTALSLTARRLDDLVTRERGFSADASHQLRTPLAALRISLETELAFPGDEPEQVLRDALDDVTRLESTIEDLLLYARTSTIEPTHLDVNALLTEVRDQWLGLVEREGRALVMSTPPHLPDALGVEPMLHQALDCLIDNAVRHGSGQVSLQARCTHESVTISVSDQGSGLPPDGAGTGRVEGDPDRNRSSNGNGNGQPDESDSSDETDPLHGFGLPLARRLVEGSQGRLVLTHSGPHPVFDVVLLRADRSA